MEEGTITGYKAKNLDQIIVKLVLYRQLIIVMRMR